MHTATMPIRLTADEVEACLRPLGARFLPSASSARPLAFASLSTDSRSVTAGALFVALVGQHTDGHRYLAQAAAQGAQACLIQADHVPLDSPLPAWVVPNTLEAYQALARAYRLAHLDKVVGVTGSVGKTSTRAWLAAALQARGPVHATEANLNNEIGLPQTLLAAPPQTPTTVVEMGMDHLGDIRLLTHIAQPDVAVLTRIGHSHLLHLGTRENILAGKMEIVEGLRPGGLLVLNAGDAYQMGWAETQTSPAAYRTLYYLDHLADTEAKARAVPRYEAWHSRLDASGRASFDLVYCPAVDQPPQTLATVHLPLPGAHQVANALAALTAALGLGLALAPVLDALQNAQTVGGRLHSLECEGLTLIDDSYNAAPESIEAGLRHLVHLAQSHGGRSIALLAGVEELGPEAPALHQAIGGLLARLQVDQAYLLGSWAPAMAEGARAAGYIGQLACFDAQEALLEALCPQLARGDYLLLKGSHAYAMGRLMAPIQAAWQAQVHPTDPRSAP